MFAERGYEDTSIEAVLREAGVSRGSLYHHFASKEALFEAVAEEVETDVGARTLAAAAGADGPVAALRAGSLAWIRLAGDPVVQDRKSTRLNSSHMSISYAVFCLKKKKKKNKRNKNTT